MSGRSVIERSFVTRSHRPRFSDRMTCPPRTPIVRGVGLEHGKRRLEVVLNFVVKFGTIATTAGEADTLATERGQSEAGPVLRRKRDGRHVYRRVPRMRR